jgi:excisionase family DNA binding protein
MAKFYSPSEVAKMLGVNPRTVARWCRFGKIKALRVFNRWKIPESEVKRLLGQKSTENTERDKLEQLVKMLLEQGHVSIYKNGSIEFDFESIKLIEEFNCKYRTTFDPKDVFDILVEWLKG